MYLYEYYVRFYITNKNCTKNMIIILSEIIFLMSMKISFPESYLFMIPGS